MYVVKPSHMSSLKQTASNIFAATLFLSAVLCTCLILGLTGCESMRTVIVNVDFDVELQVRDETTNAVRVMKHDIVKKRHPKAASPYPNIHYNSSLFEWIIGASPGTVGYFFKSNLNSPVCFRFDQATLTSNFKSTPTPLSITWTRYGEVGGVVTVERSSIYATRPMPSQCANADKGTSFDFVADYTQLFPSGQIFNINQQGKNRDYTEHGAGNWLKMRLPIEYDGKREMMEVTFTAINSVARYSYH